jgi:hypothetical protein
MFYSPRLVAYRYFCSDMREWCSVGPSLSEQLWATSDSSFDHRGAPQQKGLKRKVPSKSESDEPLVGRDVSRTLRVFVAHKLEDELPLGRRSSRP